MRYGYNFGDEITPWLLNKMFDTNLVNPCERHINNVLFSIGSLLWASNPTATIWGTGILSYKENITKPNKVCSVRGLFSRKRMLDLGYDCPETFGDPAILCTDYYYPTIKKQYSLGIIPHIIEYNEVNEIYKNVSNIKVINLRTTKIESVINEILSCEQTISSALHGLIISIIYNIPTKWVKFSNKLYGDGIKFYDFFSSIDQEVFDNFDYSLFKTQNDIYNPLIIDSNFVIDSIKNLNIDTALYPINNFNSQQIYESCPIKQ